MNDMLYSFILTTLVSLVLCTAIFVGAGGGALFQQKRIQYLLLFFLIHILLNTAGLVVQDWLFPDLKWNWLGKITSGAVMLILIFNGIPDSRDKLGWRKPDWQTGAARRSLLLMGLYILFIFSANYWFDNEIQTTGTERFLYEASLPGLEEELLFRSVVLFLFLDSLDIHRNGQVSKGKQIGVLWLGAILFGLVHALQFRFDGGIQPVFNLPGMFSQTMIGFLLGLIRLQSRSVWPAIIAHNLLSVAITLAHYLKK